MTRTLFTSAQAMLISATLAAVAVACSDGPTRPSPNPVITPPLSSVVSIGDLRSSTPQTPCKSAAHRQFDFWLGEAPVSTDGTFDGVNNVTSELDGCLVAEHWCDVGEVKGWSLNAYDPATGLWYQHCVDESGLNLLLSGGLKNGAMVLEGTRPRLAGGTFFDRVTYTPLPGGQMRQLWEQAANGAPLSVQFDGIYDPQPGAEKPPTPGTASCSGPAYHAADFLVGNWRVRAPNGLPLGHIDTEAKYIFTAATVLNGALVFTGTTALENGRQAMIRITWRAIGANLEQLWEVSRDDGASWSLDQTLIYVPV
jgi:hypothetical protein